MSKTAKRSRSASAAKSALMDLLSSAEIYQTSSADFDKRYHALKLRFNLPAYQWTFMDGYRACRNDAWYRYNLVHCYIDNDGKPFIGKWDSMTEAQRDLCRGECPIGGHFWQNKDGTIGRPFFVSKQITKDGKHDFEVVTEQYA